MNILNELGSLAESNFAEIKAKKKRLNELMDLYGENKIDIENKATNTEYMEYILAEPYVDEVLYERKSKKHSIDNLREFISNSFENLPGMVGSIARLNNDINLAYKYKKKMDNTARELVSKYGRNVGAGDNIDEYYHPLLQCVLSQKGLESSFNGLVAGYLKEGYDYIKKKSKMSKDELISDINKDLKNNLYGAMLGLKNKNADCRVLLNDRRTRNMKNENIY